MKIPNPAKYYHGNKRVVSSYSSSSKSLCVCIPKHLADSLGIKKGDMLTFNASSFMPGIMLVTTEDL